MKIINKIILLIIVSFSTFSCTKDLEVYDLKNNRLGFSNSSITSFTFAYDSKKVTMDTVSISVVTSGFITDYDRPLEIEQVYYQPTDQNGEKLDSVLQAIPGIHYIPFDDSELKDKYYIPAGRNSASIPIILKRDPSLQNDRYYLKIAIKENEYFKQSFKDKITTTFELSDMLSQPSSWERINNWCFAGEYGPVKHQFMIEVSGKKCDEDYFFNIYHPGLTVDYGVVDYLSSFYSNKLIELNKKRKSEGLGLLREAPAAPGTEGILVQFKFRGNLLPVE